MFVFWRTIFLLTIEHFLRRWNSRTAGVFILFNGHGDVVKSRGRDVKAWQRSGHTAGRYVGKVSWEIQLRHCFTSLHNSLESDHKRNFLLNRNWKAWVDSPLQVVNHWENTVRNRMSLFIFLSRQSFTPMWNEASECSRLAQNVFFGDKYLTVSSHGVREVLAYNLFLRRPVGADKPNLVFTVPFLHFPANLLSWLRVFCTCLCPQM